MNCICCKNWGKCLCHTEGNMINIYCSDIDSLGCIDEGGKPPFVPTCGEEDTTFITPIQYKERTGREYPDNAPVWIHYKGDSYIALNHRKLFIDGKYCEAEYITCAFGDLVPPDEGVVKHET